MAEVLMEYPDIIEGVEGTKYVARVCGAPATSNTWHGWIEFEPLDGGTAVRSPRETTQPNRTDTHYWATGLTSVYLQGALHRALHPLVRKPAPPTREPLFDGPVREPLPAPPASEAVLNPFSVHQKGDALLRRQLSALSSWHLVNIVRVYGISTNRREPERMEPSELIEAIVTAARRNAGTAVAE